MRKIFCILLVVLLLAGCSLNKDIRGKWQTTLNGSQIEIRIDDEKIELVTGGFVLSTGNVEKIENDKIWIDGEPAEYEINGNELILNFGGMKFYLTKAK